MMGFTDVHSHFLYGVDDGPDSRQEMEKMLDLAHMDGITTLVATPHVTPGVAPIRTEDMIARLAEAKDYCRKMHYPMELHLGAEILYTPLLAANIENFSLPTLAGTNYVLVEFGTDVTYEALTEGISVLTKHGYSVLLAHLERYDCLFSVGRVRKLKETQNVKFQLNGRSLLHGCGLRKNIFLHKWIRSGLIDCIASDAHNAVSRPFYMGKSYDRICREFDSDTAERLCIRGKYENTLI